MRKCFIGLAAALVIAACAKEQAPVSSSLPKAASSGLVPLEKLEPAEKGLTVVRAGIGDPETRLRIELNEARTAADVLWSAGDTFDAGFEKEGSSSYYCTTFTTEDDGVTSATFTNPYTLTGYSKFRCVSPEITAYSYYNGKLIYGVYLPEQQTAVAGGIESGLIHSYAYAETLTKDTKGCSLQFRNLTAILKFRLSGEVASRVRQVRLLGSDILSGDIVLEEDGTDMKEHTGIHFYDRYSRVTLSGEFEAGKDYYMVLWPRDLNGFRMEFSDGEGNSTILYSDKVVSFEASRIKDFGTISLGSEFETLNDGSLAPVRYMTATEGTKPVTIAVIPEGFTKDELPKYEELARSGIDALFEVEPYKTYRNRFNVYFLKVASKESGASVTDGNGNITQKVHSYFGVRWGENSYDDMRAEPQTIYDFVTENCPDIVNGIHTIAEVPTLVIINDERYGGVCHVESNGRGYGLVPFTYAGDGMHWSLPRIVATTDEPLPEPVTEETLQAYSRERTLEDMDEVGGSNYGDWRNTVIHEFGGHCFGRLSDEYWNTSSLAYQTGALPGHTYQVPYSLNISASYTDTPWDELLDHLDELVARDARYGRIGIFQGAGGKALFGRWRSEKISCMIDNRCYFSAWQRYLITERIFTLSDDLESFSFESWLAKDVTADPVRDSAPDDALRLRAHRTYTPVGPLPPPEVVEN